MGHLRRTALTGFLGALTVLAVTAGAWACIAGPTLDAPVRELKAGDTAVVKGVSYNSNPVVVRFNALDGPVLGTIAPTGGTAGSSNWNLDGTVAIPPGTRPGSYVLITTQPGPDGKLTQIPTRALVTVVGAAAPVVGAPLAAAQPERPVGLERGESVSTGAKVLVALGVAGVTLFIAGMAALLAGRREDPEPAPARSRTI